MTAWKRIGSLLLIAVLGCAVVPSARAADEKLTGVYKLYKLGEAIGAERFTIRFRGDGTYVAEGDTSTRIDEHKTEMSVRLETTGHENQIRAFQKEIRINEVISLYAMVDDKGTYRIASREGIIEREKTVRIDPTSVLVEPGVIHHLIPLLRRFDLESTREQRVDVYLGSEEREARAVLTTTGPEPVQMSYGRFAATRYFLNLGDHGLYLWISPEGDLLRVEDPMRGHVAELLNYKGDELPPPQSQRGAVLRRDDLEYVETSFTSNGATLSALITRPKNATGALPGIVFVSDDGPHDRDGIVAFLGVAIGTAQMMDAISAAGYVVLRYDDRGVAMSEGHYNTATLSVLEKDVQAALASLRQAEGVNPDRIALIGHGAGANLAIRMASSGADFKGVVALAPSSIPLDELAMEQLKRRLQDAGQLNDDVLRRQPLVHILEQAKTTQQQWLIYSGKAIFLGIFREYATLDPPAELALVKTPLLLMWGAQDQQVFPEHGEKLAEVCRAIEPSTCTAVRYSSLDHFFKESRGNYAEAIDPSRRVDPAMITRIVRWLDETLAGPQGEN